MRNPLLCVPSLEHEIERVVERRLARAGVVVVLGGPEHGIGVFSGYGSKVELLKELEAVVAALRREGSCINDAGTERIACRGSHRASLGMWRCTDMRRNLLPAGDAAWKVEDTDE